MSRDGSGHCRDCAIALGHLGVLAEALSSGVGDWEGRLVEGDQADWAQQAAHIRGLLARAAEDLDELAAALAEEADRVEAGGGDGPAEPDDPAGIDQHHLEILRRAHPHQADVEETVPETRWEDATVADEEVEEAEAEADLAETAPEHRHRRR